MRVGLVGLGSIGRRHLGTLAALGCEVVAMDVSVEARATARAAFPHVTYTDCLPFAGLDAVVIATPAGNHLRWVEEAIARNLPFFVEKPLGTIDQLPRWHELAALDLPVNQVGYMLRYNAALQRLRDLNPHAGELWLRWNASRYGHVIAESSHEIDAAQFLGADLGAALPRSASDIQIGPWVVRIADRASQYWRQWSVWAQDGIVSYAATVIARTPDDLGDAMYRDEIEAFVWRAAHCGKAPVPVTSEVVSAPACLSILPATLRDGLRVLDVCAQIEQVAA